MLRLLAKSLADWDILRVSAGHVSLKIDFIKVLPATNRNLRLPLQNRWNTKSELYYEVIIDENPISQSHESGILPTKFPNVCIFELVFSVAGPNCHLRIGLVPSLQKVVNTLDSILQYFTYRFRKLSTSMKNRLMYN